MRPKITTHELETYVEIPIRVFYTHNPYDPGDRTTPGSDAHIDLDAFKLESDLEGLSCHSPPLRKSINTIEELMAYIGAEYEEGLTEEAWDDFTKKQPPEDEEYPSGGDY